MDKHLTLSNLSVNAYLSPDKLHIPASEQLWHLPCTDFGKQKYGTYENASTRNREDAYECNQKSRATIRQCGIFI